MHTDEGELVYRNAGDIVATGNELLAAMDHDTPLRPSLSWGSPQRWLRSSFASKLLEPTLHPADGIQLVLEEDSVERLLAQLAIHKIDVVLSDGPVPETIAVKAFNHRLGECGLSFLGTAALCKSLRGKFTQNLHGALMLLPTASSALRYA